MRIIISICLACFINITGFAGTINKNLSGKKEKQSKTAKANDTIHYNFSVKNTYSSVQTFHLSVANSRELASETFLKDTIIQIEPTKTFKGELIVVLSDRIPVGGQEVSSVIIENKMKASVEALDFISVRSTPHPFLLVTKGILEEAKNKIENYPWAKNNLNEMLKDLDAYKVPKRKVVTKPRPVKVWSSLAYDKKDGEIAFKLSLAWKLTGNPIYKEKVIKLIKDVCDKEKGYLSIGAATTGVQVHEGNFFLFLAAACDIVFDDSSFTKVDRENIKNTFHYYLELNRKHMSGLGIMNHQASANAGAILVALFLQDMAEIEYLTDADGGMADQISKGVMADGWWFEGTANYCYLVVQRYTLIAQAFENYGLDLYRRRFPVEFKSKDFENAKEGFAGMKFDNWGPTGKNTRGLEDMVDPYICMMDENANVVASNDSNLKEPDDFYELAYREYGHEKLAWVLSKTKRDSWTSLIYGVPELPEVEDPRTESDYVSNVGLVALRSQDENQNPNEQIQAYFKFGTHGGWHGHFDRTGMIALDRNGYKYFGAEMVWYGYGKPGYKECVQTSATHNMIVVDELQQEAVPSKQVLFYKGKKMQATVLETQARWRKIPKWNSEKFPPWSDTDYEDDFKPIKQRRLSIVTDDYVVIADYVKSDRNHDFDWLLHPVGFKSIEKARKRGGVIDSLSRRKDSPYKYFANAQHYKINKGTEVCFEEKGNKLDVYTLWPKRANIVISDYPIGGKQRTMRNNPERRTYRIRVNKKESQFLHVLEPYQGESAIVKIESRNPNEIKVYLKDGRQQNIIITNFQNEEVGIRLDEFVDNKLVSTEITEK